MKDITPLQQTDTEPEAYIDQRSGKQSKYEDRYHLSGGSQSKAGTGYGYGIYMSNQIEHPNQGTN